MLKIVVESWKREGISREDFIDHLATVHGPLVAQHGRALGFRKYLQNHRIPSPEIDGFAQGRGWAPASDSGVEIWIDDEAANTNVAASEEARIASAILEEDERRFVDPSRISAFLGREEIIFDYCAPGARNAKGSPMVKMVCQVWKRADMSTPAFQDRWRIQHGDLVRTHAKAMGFLRYVQTHRVPSSAVDGFASARGWRAAPDGLTEIWWESQEAMVATFATPACAEASAILASDEVHFIDPTRITVFLAREHVVFDDIGAAAL